MLTEKKSSNLFKYLGYGQAIIYIITGLWPIFSSGSFQKITGPKVDVWLVKTVGLLVAVIGAVIGIACSRRDKSSLETRLLAISSGASLAGIDLYYVAKKRISRVYLLDAVFESALMLGWMLVWRREKAKE
jgi:hypothetical protein